jgi:hypothetical protein
VRWCVARLARYGWAAGWSRKHSTAASEQAHGSKAWPIVVPEVPKRFPAASWAHLTRRPEETTSCPLGKRRRAWPSSREPGVRAGVHVAMSPELAVLVQTADVHASGVAIETTVAWVLCGGDSHAGSAAPGGCLPQPADHRGMWRGRPQYVSRRCSGRGDSGALRLGGKVRGQWWYGPRR